MKKSQFKGSIIQLIEYLDYGDGISKQVINLHNLFLKLGIKSKIYAGSCNEKLTGVISQQNDPEIQDIVIYHYGGGPLKFYKRFATRNTTRVLLYHNITPHQFFDISPIYNFCKQGRLNLKEIVHDFHYYIGDSQYNVDELIQYGANPKKTYVWPIIVNEQNIKNSEIRNKNNSIIFVGRVVRNKAQHKLVQLFKKYKDNYPESNLCLKIVGNCDVDPRYVKQIQSLISKYNLSNYINILGKISNEELEDLYKYAKAYVSVSEHEGFGIPLIEAMLHGTPVLALDTSAIGEVMSGSIGLAKNNQELLDKIYQVETCPEFTNQLLNSQSAIVKRYSADIIQEHIKSFLYENFNKNNVFNKVSIIKCIRTHHDFDLLEEFILQIDKQTNKNFELIFSINSELFAYFNDLPYIHHAYKKISVETNQSFGIFMNAGIKVAAGDIFTFFEDSIPEVNWVDKALYLANNTPNSALAITGTDKAINNIGNLLEYNFDKDVYRVDIGNNILFKKNIFEKISFDENYNTYYAYYDFCIKIKKIINGVILFSQDLKAKSDSKLRINKEYYDIAKDLTYLISQINLKNYQIEKLALDTLENNFLTKFKNELVGNKLSEQEYYLNITKVRKGYIDGLQCNFINAISI